MGYISKLTGSITITPPLTWSEYRDTDWLTRGDRSVMLLEETHTRETDTGTLTERRAVAIVPAYDEGKHYTLALDLEAMLKDFTPIRHAFTGYLVRYGEDQGDVVRYRFTDGQVHSEKALLTWPDGEAVQTA